MSSPVLFSTGAAASSSSSRNLVEFRAGKMKLENKMVHPIKRQGLVYLHQSPDDTLMYFCWKDRQSGAILDDFSLFPDDECEFKRVPQCTTGRVYVLKIKSKSSEFYWMQEPKTDKDEEYCSKINDLLNNPPPLRPRHLPDMGSADGDLQALLHNLTNEQMSQMLGSSLMSGGGRNSIPGGLGNLANILNARSPSTTSGSATGSGSSTGPTSAGSGNSGGSGGSPNYTANSMTDIQSILSSLSNRDLAEAAALAGGQSADGVANDEARASSHDGQQQQPPIDLSSVVNLNSLEVLLSDHEFISHIEQHLPNIRQLENNSAQQTAVSDPIEKQFSDTVRSPQFKSALSQFSAALQSGQLGPLVAQFGLNAACVEAANQGNLEAFVQALEGEQQSQKSSKSSTSSTKPTGEDNSSENKSGEHPK